MWRLLQLCDSAFPAGGFTHSGGLEAATQLGEAADVERFVVDAVWQAAYGALPCVRRAHAGDVAGADEACEAFLLSHVANRASRVQARALVAACAHAFPEAAAAATHLAPAQGAIAAALGLSCDDALRWALHTAARAVLSAAVRLGRLGPLAAQRLHAALPLEGALRAVPDAPAQTAPLAELFGARHDELYSRLFQS